MRFKIKLIALTLVVIASTTLLFNNCSGFKVGLSGIPTGAFHLPSATFFAAVAGERELFLDNRFENGIAAIQACQNPDTNPACGQTPTFYQIKNPYYPDKKDLNAVWSLAQWDSKSSIASTGTFENGGTSFADSSKRVTIFPDGKLEFATSGLAEYDGVYGKKTFTLILQQSIDAPPQVSEMESLKFSVDMQLIFNDRHITNAVEAAKGAAIFPVNFILQNLNPSSPGYQQYLWLQFNTFDDRTAFPEHFFMLDPGTKMFMYNIPYRDFSATSLHSASLVHLEADILPHVKLGLQKAFDGQILKSTQLSDYRVSGFNIGFEVSSLNVTTIQFKNLSLRMKSSQAAEPIPPAEPISFTNLTTEFRSTFDPNSVTGGQATHRSLNTATGRSAVLNVTMDPATHKILGVTSPQPYFCYDQNEAPCGLVTVPGGYPGAGSRVQNCSSPIKYEGAMNGWVSGLSSALVCGTPTKEPNGFFKLNSALYFSNGNDAFCHISAWDDFILMGNTLGNHNVHDRSDLPSMANHGVCPSPAQPTGFFRIGSTDGVYFSNGGDAFCLIADWDFFLRLGGNADGSNVTSRTALPSMRNDGICK
jgi:hypothetical protein